MNLFTRSSFFNMFSVSRAKSNSALEWPLLLIWSLRGRLHRIAGTLRVLGCDIVKSGAKEHPWLTRMPRPGTLLDIGRLCMVGRTRRRVSHLHWYKREFGKDPLCNDYRWYWCGGSLWLGCHDCFRVLCHDCRGWAAPLDQAVDVMEVLCLCKSRMGDLDVK